MIDPFDSEMPDLFQGMPSPAAHRASSLTRIEAPASSGKAFYARRDVDVFADDREIHFLLRTDIPEDNLSVMYTDPDPDLPVSDEFLKPFLLG